MGAAVELTAPTFELTRLTPDVLAEPVTAKIAAKFMGPAAMVTLAVLDLIGSYCAMRYLHTGHQGWWSAGAASFVLLFAVYSASLHWAELSAVTLGWIVLLQLGVIALDRIVNGIILPPTKWLALAGVLLLMGYILVAPNRQAYKPKHAARTGPPPAEVTITHRILGG